MSRPQRPDNKKDGNLLTAEFSTGQLVVAICLSLFVAMACFGLGILVARVDPSFEQNASEPEISMTPSPGETITYEMPAFDRAPTQSEPRPQDTAAQRTPETPPPRSPFMDNEPRLTTLPPLSPQRPSAAPVAAPTRPPREDAAAQPRPSETGQETLPPEAPTPTEQPVTPPRETAVPMLTPIDPVEPPLPTPVSPQNAIRKERGKFGVQLASFSGNDRRARAETFQRLVREQLNVEAEIILSDDDVHHRLVVVGFSSRESANAACAELRRKAGLNEAFVRPL